MAGSSRSRIRFSSRSAPTRSALLARTAASRRCRSRCWPVAALATRSVGRCVAARAARLRRLPVDRQLGLPARHDGGDQEPASSPAAPAGSRTFPAFLVRSYGASPYVVLVIFAGGRRVAGATASPTAPMAARSAPCGMTRWHSRRSAATRCRMKIVDLRHGLRHRGLRRRRFTRYYFQYVTPEQFEILQSRRKS